MPVVATTIPPIAGPMTAPALNTSWLRAIALWSRSRGTSRGMADARAGWSTEPSPAATKASAYTAHSGGTGRRATAASPRVTKASATWVTSSSRRRSTASATAPPPSENARIGTSWTSDSAPTARTSCVST